MGIKWDWTEKKLQRGTRQVSEEHRLEWRAMRENVSAHSLQPTVPKQVLACWIIAPSILHRSSVQPSKHSDT
jgi:hypothetical protein